MNQTHSCGPMAVLYEGGMSVPMAAVHTIIDGVQIHCRHHPSVNKPTPLDMCVWPEVVVYSVSVDLRQIGPTNLFT